MALTVGELQVLLSGDPRKLNRELDRLDARAGQTEKAHTSAWSRIGSLAGAAIKAGMVVATGAVAGLSVAIKKGLDMASFTEQAEISFGTLLGSAEAAKSYLGDLQTFARNTPFELQGVVESAQRLLGVGAAAETVIPTLTAWGDAAGALGLSQDQFGRTLTAVTQMMGKGKVSAEEMLQITEAGIPIWMLLAKATGKPVPELQKLAAEGKLLAEDVLPLLEEQMNADYGGSMEKQAGTLSGLWSAAKDDINLALKDAVLPLAAGLKTVLPGASAAAATAIRELGVRGSEGLVNLIKRGQELREQFGPELGKLGELAAQKWGMFVDLLGELGSAVAPSLPRLVDSLLRIAQVGGEVAEAMLPALTAGLRLAGPLASSLAGTLNLVANVLEAIEPVLPLVVGGFLAFKSLSAVNGWLRGFGKELDGTTGKVAGFAQSWRMNMSLAGDDVGRLAAATGGFSAAAAAHMPKASAAFNNFSGSLRSAYEQGRMLSRLNVMETYGADAVARGTGQIAGFGAAAKQAAVGGVGALRSGAGGLTSFLGGPWGVGLAAGALMVGSFTSQLQKASSQTDEWAQALLDGGHAATEAMKAYEAGRDKQPFEWMADLDEWTGLASSMDEAKQAADDLYAAMNPLQQANQDVTKATNELLEAQELHGAGSNEAAGKARVLASEQRALEIIQRNLENATRGATAAIADQAQQAIASANAELGFQSSLMGTQQAITDYTTGIQDGSIAADERAQKEVQLAQQINSTVMAAGAAAAETHKNSSEAERNAAVVSAQRDAFNQLTGQLGYVPAALQKVGTDLNKAGVAAGTTAEQMQALGLSVLAIPGNKTVFIEAPTAEQKKRLDELGLRVMSLPNGRIYVTADTSPAEGTLAAFMNTRRTIQIQAQLNTGGIRYQGAGQQLDARASGGPVAARTPYIVGEEGQELFVPDVPGTIIDAKKTAAMLAAAGNQRASAMLPGFASPMGGRAAGSGASLFGSGSGQAAQIHHHRHYELKATVDKTVTVRELVALQREADALYG